jgi:hypothetical protein
MVQDIKLPLDFFGIGPVAFVAIPMQNLPHQGSLLLRFDANLPLHAVFVDQKKDRDQRKQADQCGQGDRLRMAARQPPGAANRSETPRQHRSAGEEPLHIVGQRFGGCVTLAWRLHEALQANRFQVARHRGNQPGWCDRLLR